ncbi:hypothetical protein Drorol1_Dr00011029 [Drosera rotundifolia]
MATSATLHIILLTLTILPLSVTAVPSLQLDAALAALRLRGYSLVCNSITVSDLRPLLLSLPNFTLLSPPDPSLFSLDLSSDATSYLSSLRFHLLNRRLTSADLRAISLSHSPYVETLVPGHMLYVGRRGRGGGGGEEEYVAANGVRVSNPDVFLGDNVAVHGLDGALAVSVAVQVPPPVSVGGHGLGFVASPVRSVSPRRDSISTMSPFLAPVSAPSSDSYPFAESPAVLAPISEPAAAVETKILPPISDPAIPRSSPPLVTITAKILPPPASDSAIPRIPAPPVTSTATMSPPYDLANILPLNHPLIWPQIPETENPRSPPADSSEIGDGSSGIGREGEDPRRIYGDNGGVVAGTTSPYQFAPPQFTRPAAVVNSPPAIEEEGMPVPEIPEQRFSPPWNSWTELMREFAPSSPVDGSGVKRSSGVGMKDSVGKYGKGGNRGGVDEDYGYGGKDFDLEDVNSMFHG